MRILLWPTHYLPHIGGLEIMTHALAIQLKNIGHKVFVISNHSNSLEFEENSIEGIKIFTFPFVTALFDYNLPLIKKILQKIDQIFEDFSPDIVNIHGWFECFAFYQVHILQKKSLPLCLTIHGLLEQSHYHTNFCLKLWSRASSVSTVSQALISSLAQIEMTHHSLQLIYNGLPLPLSPLQPISNPLHLVLIGRLSEEKCFDVAFYAIKMLIAKYPNLKVHLLGGGILYKDLFQLRNSLELEHVIEMTDFLPPDQIYNYIDQSSAVIIPSSYESFCLVALQAALRARPVVASNVYGLKEVVEHNKTGILVEPKNPKTLAEGIDQLLSNFAKMKQMGEEAYMRGKTLFTIQNTAKNYVEMYENVVCTSC